MRITIIGPRSVGKSTVGKILAKKLNLKYYSSDNLMDKKMQNLGGLNFMMKSGDKKTVDSNGLEVIKEQMKKKEFVFDLAGGVLASKVKSEVLEEISTTISIGLIPFEDDEKSIELLFKRERKRPHFSEKTDEELFAKVKKDYLKIKPEIIKELDLFFFTKDKTVEQIVDEIMKIVACESIKN